jgi:3-oxoacyl-[acyl-carrier protein] reductase
MSEELLGKVALVTGGSRGIGAAIARRLAADGADVAISYVNAADEGAATLAGIEGHGRKALSVWADQADRAQAGDLVRQVADHFGRLDILVNNAGVFITGPVDDPNRDQETFDRQLAINVQGVVSAVLAAVPVIADGGRIVSVSTAGAASTRVPFPGLADYFASKAAVAAYTKGWARDLGPRGITVNAVAPGPIDTDMNPADSEWADTQASLTALGHFGKPADVAAAVAYLVSPGAGFVTGIALTVDGGLSAL